MSSPLTLLSMFPQDFGPILGLMILVLAICYALKKKTYELIGEEFPVAPGAGVFTGHMKEILKEPGHNIFKVAERHAKALDAPAVHIKAFFGDKMLIITDFELAKEVLVSNGSQTSDRPPAFSGFVHMKQNVLASIVTSSGQMWKTNRKIFANQLRIFGRERLWKVIGSEAEYLTEVLEKETQNGAFDPLKNFQMAVSNVICTLCFGNRFDYHDTDFKDALDCLAKITTGGKPVPKPLRVLNDYVNILPWLTEKKNSVTKLKSFCRKYIKQRISIKEQGCEMGEATTFVDAYIRCREKDVGVIATAVEEMADLVFELFFAGSESSSVTLLWALQFLSAHPLVQATVHREIDSLRINSGHGLDESSIKSLHYFRATQSEIQRLATVAVSTIANYATETIILPKDRIIKKGIRFMASIFSIHRDPQLWKHPNDFNPENFLDDKGEFTSNEAFIPFGLGPRFCLGEKIADAELKVFLFSILQKMRVSCDEPIDLEYRQVGISSRPEKHRYSFHKRF